MNRCIIFLLGLLIISGRSIIAADDPDDPNVKTPDEASKTLPSTTTTPQVSTSDKKSRKQKNGDNRSGRKRRRRSVESEHKKFFNQTKKENL